MILGVASLVSKIFMEEHDKYTNFIESTKVSVIN